MKHWIIDKLKIASQFDILVVIEAILEKEKYGKIRPKTKKRLKAFYDYYKERNPNYSPKVRI